MSFNEIIDLITAEVRVARKQEKAEPHSPPCVGIKNKTINTPVGTFVRN